MNTITETARMALDRIDDKRQTFNMQFREVGIAVYAQGIGEPTGFGVNWSGIGTVVPDAADEYAEAIKAAAEFARTLTDELKAVK